MARRTLAILSIALLPSGAAGALAEDSDPLEGYRWRARVLVLSAPNPDDAALRAQRQALAAMRPGAAERDLVTIEALGSDRRAQALRQRLRLPADAFRAVLVGKDGGAKLTSAEPIPPQTLFSTIDAMPMRRNETRPR